jgi:integrase
VLRRQTIGDARVMTLADARKVARATLDKAAAGEDPARMVQVTNPEKRTIEFLIDEYLTRWARPKKRSAAEDERMLKRELLGIDVRGRAVAGMDGTWRGRAITDIKRRDVVELLDRIVDRGSPVMANRALAGVRRMFNFAIERGLVETTPCFRVKPPGRETPRERVLSDAEVVAFWAALSRSRMEPNMQRLLRFMLATAQRAGEIAGMGSGEIDLERKTWTVPAERAKNGREHVVPLSPLALSILEQTMKRAGEADWIFSAYYTGQPYRTRSIDQAVRDLLMHRPARSDRAPVKRTRALPLEGVAAFTPHDLRRTATTRMRELGISREDVALVLNHKDRSVTGRHYDRYEGLREKQRALEVWAEKLEALISACPAATSEHAQPKIVFYKTSRGTL